MSDYFICGDFDYSWIDVDSDIVRNYYLYNGIYFNFNVDFRKNNHIIEMNLNLPAYIKLFPCDMEMHEKHVLVKRYKQIIDLDIHCNFLNDLHKGIKIIRFGEYVSIMVKSANQSLEIL